MITLAFKAERRRKIRDGVSAAVESSSVRAASSLDGAMFKSALNSARRQRSSVCQVRIRILRRLTKHSQPGHGAAFSRKVPTFRHHRRRAVVYLQRAAQMLCAHRRAGRGSGRRHRGGERNQRRLRRRNVNLSPTVRSFSPYSLEDGASPSSAR